MRKILGAILLAVLLAVGCGSGGGNSGNNILPPNDNAITCSIQATPNIINQGDSATITWVSTNADTVRISGLPDVTSPSGVVVVTPDVTTTYTAVARAGLVESAPVEVTVTVITIVVPPPPPPPPPPVITVYIQVTWDLPTTYNDGSPLDPSMISVMLFMKADADPFTDTDLPIVESLAGATYVDFGPVDINRNETYYFSCKAKAPTGEISEFSPTVIHIWE